MFKIKPIMSQSPADCGLYSLQMLLSYYGKKYIPASLVIYKNGSTAKAIMDCGKKHGLDMRAYKIDSEEIIRQDRPSIILWDGNHWCVCCGKGRGNKVYICDSLIGRYWITEEIFASRFYEIALVNGELHDI